jgi:hypothetical protein
MRTKATSEEAQTIVSGSIAYYGSYTLNEADKSSSSQTENAGGYHAADGMEAGWSAIALHRGSNGESDKGARGVLTGVQHIALFATTRARKRIRSDEPA